MNIGQILETHLGWAARALGMQIEAGAEGLLIVLRKPVMMLKNMECLKL